MTPPFAAWADTLEPDEYQLESEHTPLGLLQRGRGRGFLWALDHPEEARPLLVRCITCDPRWDRQIDSRAPYYAEIALAVGLDLSLLERHLREHDDVDRDGYQSLLTVETIHAIACAGSDEALDALLPVVRARFPSREALVTALDHEWPDYSPWRQWASRDAEIAAALAEAETVFLRRQRPRVSGAHLSTRELLARPDVRSFRHELAARRGDEDVALLLEAARSGTGDAQATALIALGEQNELRVLEPALSRLPFVLPRPASSWLRYAILHVLSGLPADPGLGYARRWYDADHFLLRRSAEKLFARHAAPEDAPMLRTGARRAFEQGDDYRVCSAMDALARIPRLGPYPEVQAVFDGHRYSRARADAAAALAATDPSFPRDRAFECLWDCEESTRATGSAHVDLARPGARERLARLASDPLEGEEVRKAAQDALRR